MHERCTTNSRPVEILHCSRLDKGTREKGRSTNFARVVCTIFGGKGSKIKVACLVYLVRCLYPSDVYEWYSTVVNDRLEIHLFPFRPFTPPRFVFSSSFLSPSPSLFSFRPCYRVAGCADRAGIGRLTWIREIDRWNVCAYNTRNRGGNNPNCRE